MCVTAVYRGQGQLTGGNWARVNAVAVGVFWGTIGFRPICRKIVGRAPPYVPLDPEQNPAPYIDPEQNPLVLQKGKRQDVGVYHTR